jgi:DNA mismatch repair protein MutS
MANAQTKGRTPLMRQYYALKERHPQAILLYRMGDFYEAFDDDAETISDLLGITLTTRNNGQAEEVPMAGFPHHALEKHLPKLVESGLRMAICEQVEDADEASGKVVERDVVEIVTPGASMHEQLLSPKQANYVAAVHWGRGHDKDTVGLAYIDVSTGEFAVAEAERQALPELLQTVSPSEVIIDKANQQKLQQLPGEHDFTTTTQEDWAFTYDFAYETLTRHFETHSMKGFGVDDMEIGLVAAGAALHYAGETQKSTLPHIQRLQRHERSTYMTLDPQTKRNLELVTTIRGRGQDGSLVEILDETATAMGGRLLRNWLVRPLRKVNRIRARLDAVEALHADRDLREDLREVLGGMGDLERLAAKVATERATPRDLVAIKNTLKQIPALKELLSGNESDKLQMLNERLSSCDRVVQRIEEALVDEPPANIGDGGLIRDGYSDDLDELREIAQDGKEWITETEQEEAERTGIPSLKVGFNKVFGYYLEVTNTHKDKVPDEYIRKQTLKNSERYITPELKEVEEKILNAEERMESLEYELFQELRMALAEETGELQENAHLAAMLDVFAALAEVADRRDYTRPDVHEGRELAIEDGRHPVVEQSLAAGDSFIPNDVTLDPESEQLLIITGPNMAGKSVVLRQTGLIVLLAQIGAFVPAGSARVGVVDRIFTRVGASDNLAAGESTFLVEMNETANILNNATPDSLILLDEVGRGTSTFDGLSIAWALVEFLHEHSRLMARTLFATHYHELNALSDRFERIKNYRIQVQKHEGEIIFLRKLIPGGADHSYGIEVARMAGLPEPVIGRAREVLAYLESHQLDPMEAGDDEAADDGTATAGGDGVPAAKQATAKASAQSVPDAEKGRFQRSLFQADPALEEIKADLDDLDPDRMTPVEALLKLSELKEKVSG